jgi:hypothetical protein
VNDAVVDRAGTEPGLATMATTMTRRTARGTICPGARSVSPARTCTGTGLLTQLTTDQTLEQRLAGLAARTRAGAARGPKTCGTS